MERKKQMLQSEVRSHNGAPALFIDGSPRTGCMFWHSKPLEAGEDLRLFAKAGVNLFTTGFRFALQPDGTFDTKQISSVMDVVLAANPQALVLPRVNVEPPKWWMEKHPDEVQVHADAVNGDEFRKFISFGSQLWRDEMGAALPEFIRRCEERWGEHVLGYHLCAGDCGEWAYIWAPAVSGYSVSQRNAFRNWLRQRYNNNVRALQQAWNDEGVTFDTATVPRNRVRDPNAWPRIWSFFKPETEQANIDYQFFHSQAVADAIAHFAAITKRTLHDLGTQKICGVFYAYHISNENTPHVAHNAGHHAHEPVLHSPDIDFISCPMTYNQRQSGGHFHSQLLPASIRLHGKLYWCEDDTFTHLAKETPWRPKCKDAEETANVLWRNFAGTLCDTGAYWWMDHDGDGWYRDDYVMQEVAAMAKLAEKKLKSDRTPDAEIAVVCSPQSMNYLRYDTSLVDALLPNQISELLSLGAPLDFYAADDLELLLQKDYCRNYRMVIFMDAIYLSERQRDAIRKLQSDGRTFLYIYAAGVLSDDGFSLEAMSDLTGFDVSLRDRVLPIRAETFITGTRLTYGTSRDIGPEFVGELNAGAGADADADDASVEVLGWSQYRGDPSFMRRRFEDWTSIWSATPVLPAVVLRQLACEAGVHIFVETGDRFCYHRGLMALHASFTGEHDVKLPRAADVLDMRTGCRISTGTDRFSIQLARGETAVFQTV